MQNFDLVVIGGGPAGLQAALAAQSEGWDTLVIEAEQVGGMVGKTPRLENTVVVSGVKTGPEFAAAMHAQCLRFGVTFAFGKVVHVHANQSAVYVQIQQGEEVTEVRGRRVVAASGMTWRKIGWSGAESDRVVYGPVSTLTAKQGETVAVVGAGPAAGQAIIHLADAGCRVVAFWRGKPSMPKYLGDGVKERLTDGVVEIVHYSGEARFYHALGEIAWKPPTTSKRKLMVDRVVVCAGLVPNTDYLKGVVELDEAGFVETPRAPLGTKVPRIYAVGTCRAGSTQRVGTALGEGSTVVTQLWEDGGPGQ